MNATTIAAAEGRTVLVHGFKPGPCETLEYADETDPDLSGWSVCLRTPTPRDPVQPFDLNHESDWPTKDAALTAAATLARKFRAVIDVF